LYIERKGVIAERLFEALNNRGIIRNTYNTPTFCRGAILLTLTI